MNDDTQLRALLKRCTNEAPDDYARLQIRQLPKAKRSIAYVEYGDPKGRPLLCLHGLSISGLCFEHFHDDFIALGVRAIAPSLLGGIYIADGRKNIDDIASEIIELLDELSIDKFDVIGFSWGTLPQLALLARVPGRIGRAGFLGAMTPVTFIGPQQIAQLKTDIQITLKMVKRMPLVHRIVMWLFCRLPGSTFINQFKDDNLPAREVDALAPGSDFSKHFLRYLKECLRTGSQFLTDGWRMFLDRPAYALHDLANNVDVRLYVAEKDNVHLLYFSEFIAAAITGTQIDAVCHAVAAARAHQVKQTVSVFDLVYAQEQCSIWMIPGAGRIACMLYFKEALNHFLKEPLEAAVFQSCKA